jgi:hypothetical protein
MPKKNSKVIMDNNVLTEGQKTQLKGVIDELVEERAREITKEFIQNYTSFIVESVTKKVVSKTKNNIMSQINEEIDRVKSNIKKVTNSVILEASEKIKEEKEKSKTIVEEFKRTAPKLINRLAEEKANQLSEEAIQSINDAKKSKDTKNQMLTLKTEMTRLNRDLKIKELTEGMLPIQREKAVKMLEECTTAKMVERNFDKIRSTVLSEGRIIKETKKPEVKKDPAMLKEESFEDLIKQSSSFMTTIY